MIFYGSVFIFYATVLWIEAGRIRSDIEETNRLLRELTRGQTHD